jgi:hypothetical protein
VYLFNKIPVGKNVDYYTAKTIDVILGGKTARRLSLKEVSALPLDAEGYHLLTFRTASGSRASASIRPKE